MPGYADLVREMVAFADEETQSLQPVVTLRRWKGSSESGDDSYHTNEPYPALVEKKVMAVKGLGGQDVVVAKTYVAFLRPIPSLSSLITLGAEVTRTEPLDEQDVIILPDGETGPIKAINGFVDKDTLAPFLSEVWLG